MKPYVYTLFLAILLGATPPKSRPLHCRVFVVSDTSDVSLDLEPATKKFQIVKAVQMGEHGVNINTLVEGIYSYTNNVLKLIDSKSGQYEYELADSVTLKPKFTAKSAVPPSNLYCSCMYRKDGSMAWRGFWKNGKKNNIWSFYNQVGKPTKTLYYEAGVEKKIAIHPSLSPKNF